MSSQATPPSVTEREFRDAMGLFPTGVAIVTAVTSQGVKLGVTVSSFTSVSLDPPLVSFALAKAAYSFAEWREIKHFAVNLLAEEQDHLSTRFARSLADKWSGLTPISGQASAAPLLQEALAAFECGLYAQYDGGDHVIILGRLLSITQNSQKRPLVFYKSAYHRLEY